MINSNSITKFVLVAGMALAGASALPAQDWRYRDMGRDYRTADRIRDDMARDRARLYEDMRSGRRWAVERDRADLYRDQRALEAVRADFRRDYWRRNSRDYDRRDYRDYDRRW